MIQDLRVLKARNTNTGEVCLFTLTRAGIYSFAKFAATSKNCSISDALYSMKDWEMFSDLIGNRWTRNHIISDIKHKLTGDECWFADSQWFNNIVFDNIKNSNQGKIFFEEDLFSLNGRFYPRTYRKYLARCEDCGEIFFDQNLLDKDGKGDLARFIRSSDIGINGYCNNCYDRYCYRQCDDCGRICDSNDLTDVEGDYICNDCLHNGDYYCCDYCGNWFHCDSDDAQFPEDHCYCSIECCENDGWRWSERRDCWVGDDDDYYDNEIDEIITDYHSRDVSFHKNGEMKLNQKHWLGGGTETEVDGLCRYDYDYDYYTNLLSLFGGTKCAYFEQDSSVEFEIISQPMTEKFFKSYDWEKPFSKLMQDGWKSHDTTTCGRHYHYSVWYLGYTDKQRKDSAKKICRFFQLFENDIKKIARRDFNHYTMNLNNFRKGEITSKTDFYDLSGDRYWAVNLTNMERDPDRATIEIRICKGTLKASTTVASFDFFLHIVRNAKSIAWKDIDNLSLWLKGIKDKNTIDYIKSRHAFVGAF